MSSLGAKAQFRIAVALAVIIPLLVGAYLITSGALVVECRRACAVIILIALAPLVVFGFALMTRYPKAIVRLRGCLEQMSEGQLSVTVKLPTDERDLAAIADCLLLILDQTHERLRTIRDQREQLARSEEDRVTSESLGAACHHLGQPAQALRILVQLLDEEQLGPRASTYLGEMRQGVEWICAIAHKMQSIAISRALARSPATDPLADTDVPDLEPRSDPTLIPSGR